MKISFAKYRELLTEKLAPQKTHVGLLAALMFAGIGAQLVNPQIIQHFIDLTQTAALTIELVHTTVGFIVIALVYQALKIVAT